jgi:chromosomal replication initiator protein
MTAHRDWLFGEPRPGICRIAYQVAARTGVTIDDLKSPKKARVFSRPRQAAMYLAHRNTDKSTTQIGRFFNRDHTTVLHAIRAVESAPHLYPIGEVRE